MNPLILWSPLAASLVFLAVAIFRLGAKRNKLDRHLQRTDRYRAKFENRMVASPAEPAESRIPSLREAYSERKVFIKMRSKKRADKQRRLVTRLKNRS
jgi:hypothetical protein